MIKTQTQNKNGEWIEATPIPYYPNILEKIWHFIGFHVWTIGKTKKCVMCAVVKRHS